MKILHTSDWHLGKRLCGQERESEFEAFLDWLTELIQRRSVASLIVAGDIFDSATPPLWAQKQYLTFLVNLGRTCCKSVVITGGNHDSGALLDLTRDLLGRFGVHVTGCSRAPSEEVFELPDETGAAGAVCCAVPYLRARDLCGALAGEDPDGIRRAELAGFAAHYRAACGEAEHVRAGRDIPLIATGHCFVAGGHVTGDDGVRDLAVGSLESVPLSAFPDGIDYLALGHLHSPQVCGGRDNARYSGAPLVLGFGEVGMRKSVYILDTAGRRVSVTEETVPSFRKIMNISGTFEELSEAIASLAAAGEEVWLSAECTESTTEGLNDRLRELAEGGPVRLLRVKAARLTGTEAFSGAGEGDLNEDWSPRDVFRTFLDDNKITEPESGELMRAYLEILDRIMSEGAEGGAQ